MVHKSRVQYVFSREGVHLCTTVPFIRRSGGVQQSFFKKEYRYPIESILKLPYLVLSYFWLVR